MAVNFQNSTLSLTLPISCQICLGKVRQPVICGNHHVFCSSCMEMWLKNASQCPTCRVPISAESPCREIIGGTNESDYLDSPSMRNCLRKTRGELLLREYEEEIDGLMRENEELKTKNLHLEEQLKTALHPCSVNSAQPDDKKVSPFVMEEWKSKLQTATDVCDKIKQDMDKLREANKSLRSQNVNLIHENTRLKTEVASRSPQKFGRYTVAALESKIQQHERDVEHLKRALERSDQYIDELEAQVRKSEKKHLEVQDTFASSNSGADVLKHEQKFNMMMRSLSDNERMSICSNPEVEFRTFSRNPSLVFQPSVEDKSPNGEQKKEDLESTSSDFLPTTPSSAFRSLTLRSPGLRGKKVAFKPVPHLRKLNFEENPSPSQTASALGNKFSSVEKSPKGLSDMDPSKSIFWGSWHPGPSEDNSVKESTSANAIREDPNSFQTSSEASMDAAYLDKISELDSMMLDGESSSSRGSQLSLTSSPPGDLNGTLTPESQICPDSSSGSGGKPAVQGEDVQQDLGSNMDDTLISKEAPSGSEDNFSVEGGPCRFGSTEHREPSQTDELSFDLLFDHLDQVEAVPSGSLSPEAQLQDQDHVTSSSSGCTGSKPVNTRDRHALNSSQPVKRKSHSPFNSSSPTKLSKLM
ncbi:ORC ubiquitin ligase 1 [Nothobranchius furzeri]|uniref:Ring finger protein 219 n=1 Tax=Nothobranchius furzeri TaxID=105023 RepID=A0A1A8V4X0_NOTFU|nr:ORC ubiquitin ligase 1 [Nothobranchius furzeri]KAF7212294.1 ring finger protein 219 [Nothobranchius furzeri]